MSKRSDEKVHVAVRCRPMTESERTSRVRRVVECNSKSREVNVMTSSNGLGLGTSQQTKAYSFDKVFGPKATQLDVYNGVVSGQLNDVLSGYNCTVLAYGQTGTGKTFTMEGERTLNREFSWDTDPRAGIIPRALSQLFDQLESSGCEFSVRVSLLEIYNEEIYDLLSPGNGMLKMKIYEDHNRKGSVVVSGLTEVLIRDKSDVYDILQQGSAKRRTAATDLNEFSSRSHSVFSVTVHTKDISTNQMEEEELIKIGKLNLVDLAGSENIGRSGAVDKRAREAGSINTSLLTLGRCITALVDRAPHVPYRESKLTRLLQDSLGGATKTSIIATISPGNDNLDETLSTLDYASRAKNIHNRPRVNQKLTKRALIKEYDEEIQRLQREVLAAREKNGVYLDPKQYQEMTEKIESLTATLQQRKEDLDKYQKLFTDASNELEEKNEQLSTLKDDLEQTQLKLSEQCFIKEVHIEHGNQLTERATELLETANVLTDDITKVHDKVDRVKDANEHNLDAANAFTNKIKGDVELLCDGTNVILQESENNLQHMLTGLEDLKERQDGNVLCIKTQITQFRDTMKDAFQTNCSKMQQAMDKMSDLNEKQQSIFDVHKTEMNSIMTSSVLELEKKCETITSNLLSLIQNLQTSFDFQRDQMRKEAERMKDHQDSIRSEAAEIEARNNEVLKAGKNNLDDMVEKVNQQMRESIAAALSSLVDSNTKNCQSLSKLTQSADDVNEATVTSTNERIKQLDQVQEQAVSILQESANSSEAVLLQQKSCQEQLCQDMETFASDAQSNYDTTIKEWSSSIESSTENVKALSDASVSLETKCSEELSLFDEFAVSRLESIVEAAGEVSSNISVAKESFKGASETVGTEVDEYYRDRLVRVLPTGETPARKQYSYSHRIPERPEEEDVLLKFQEQMQLAELEEDADEEDVVACDDEASDESQDTETSSEQKMPGVGEADLDQSITIPSIGGRPFFTNRKGGKSRGQKLHANNNTKAKCATRLPLRATHNTGF